MRPSARNRGYGSKWNDVALPFCGGLLDARTPGAPATEVDHVPPRRDLVRVGVPDPDADCYLHARCARCHNCRTAAGG